MAPTIPEAGSGKGVYVRYNAFLAFGIKPYADGARASADDAGSERSRIAGALLDVGVRYSFSTTWNELIPVVKFNLESALTERLVKIRPFLERWS